MNPNEELQCRAFFLFVVFAVVILACRLLTGCVMFQDRPERDADDFPFQIANQCHTARADAIRWYVRKYGEQPKVPKVKVTLEERPYNGGAWTTSAWDIHFWINQHPIQGSLNHEFRHSLNKYNGKRDTEDDVR